jgi:hypothetical protein
MLEKIFTDLSSRRQDKLLSLDSFLLFFNLNVQSMSYSGVLGAEALPAIRHLQQAAPHI